ncbi:MAG: FoF1 ATP synthase subunit gamma [Chloroflexota bacterium]|nr:FoF1 ATP synthase subunit gamma [Chloroflexota bacterium]
MEDLERAEIRLDNIRTVEPILSALRTISLGSWQATLKRKDNVRRYAERLAATLPPLLPHLPGSRRLSRLHFHLPRREGKKESVPITALVVGSERGLCGRFNVAVVERAERYLVEQEMDGTQVELMALGTQAQRLFQQRGRPLTWSGMLSVTALPPYRLAFDLTRRWLARYEKHELDAVDLVHNAYHGTGIYEPTVTRLIPPTLLAPSPDTLPWPPPIIESNPLSLYTRVVEQWAAASLYELLLDSAAAEHAARYQLMEAATQNTERLISELTLAVQMARQQAITQEMQELAVGAGLIGPR